MESSKRNIFLKVRGFLKNPFFYLVLILLSFFFFRLKPEKKLEFKMIEEKFSQHPFFDSLPKSESPEFILVQKNTIKPALPPNIISPKVLAGLGYEEESGPKEIIEYTVEEGDSLWGISKKFGITIETIVWANDLRNLVIKPGQTLLILPVSGVFHIAREGETIEDLAKKYKTETEKILAFNEISERDLFAGQLLIIPGGQMPFSPRIEIKSSSLADLSTNNFYGKSHAYPQGQCTWWVAQKRPIPSWGNAREWLKKAIASGYPACQGSNCPPQIGAIISLRTSYALGHVGYVERIEEGKVIFSEMNYIGWGKVNYRSLKIGDSRILGYIY
jgi:surface antigen